MIDEQGGYTPTPVISHAILRHNRGRTGGMADGIVITPSHNPPEDGGFKYNPPHGGPADTHITDWIEAQANALLADELRGVHRIPFERAQRLSTTHRHDYMEAYISDLTSVVDLEVLTGTNLTLGVDPQGGAGVHYWGIISDRYALPLTVVNEAVDPTFRCMTLDWDGKTRMDCSSPYAMQWLIAMKDRFVGLLAAEMTAVMGRDPGELYRQLTAELGGSLYQLQAASETTLAEGSIEHIGLSKGGLLVHSQTPGMAVDEPGTFHDHQAAVQAAFASMEQLWCGWCPPMKT